MRNCRPGTSDHSAELAIPGVFAGSETGPELDGNVVIQKPVASTTWGQSSLKINTTDYASKLQFKACTAAAVLSC